MKSKFMQKFNSIFNSDPKVPKQSATKKSQMNQPRVISFGNAQKGSKSYVEQEDYQQDEGIDVRYSKNQNHPPLKDLGLKKDEIQKGQIAMFVQDKLIFYKSAQDKYEKTFVVLTNFKLCLQLTHQRFSFIALGKIQRLNRYIENDTVYKVLIQLKDGRKLKFRISSQENWKKFYQKIQMFSFIRFKNNFFAFRYFQEAREIQEQFRGWNLYDARKQFERMGIVLASSSQQASTDLTSDFKILDNTGGNICSTYPPIVVVPSRISKDSLTRCAKFRSRERMPALTYAYQYQDGKFSSIFRCSQSKVGVQNSRSIDDEMVLRYIGNPQTSEVEKDKVNCKIYDARNYYAALGNKIAGKGYESKQFYTNCNIQFFNIANIHAVRQSFNKVLQACEAENSKFYTLLAQSKWYEYVFVILSGSLDLAKTVYKGMNSVVHCSDGWDRTSQLCALGALLLDPYYRTTQGFLVLIQKDWIYFGHQFTKRLAQGINDPSSQEKSQVFLQFLDCVTQILYQFPRQFQFDYKLIFEIADQAYSHLYGNFLCNSYLQMQKCKIFAKTVSLWSKILKDKNFYLNPFYAPSLKQLLSLDVNQKNMRIWKEYFFQNSNTQRDVYGIYTFRYTYENLQIMQQNLIKQIALLSEKSCENEHILSNIDAQIYKLQYKNKSEEFSHTQSIQCAMNNKLASKPQIQDYKLVKNEQQSQQFNVMAKQLPQQPELIEQQHRKHNQQDKISHKAEQIKKQTNQNNDQIKEESVKIAKDIQQTSNQNQPNQNTANDANKGHGHEQLKDEQANVDILNQDKIKESVAEQDKDITKDHKIQISSKTEQNQETAVKFQQVKTGQQQQQQQQSHINTNIDNQEIEQAQIQYSK